MARDTFIPPLNSSFHTVSFKPKLKSNIFNTSKHAMTEVLSPLKFLAVIDNHSLANQIKSR